MPLAPLRPADPPSYGPYRLQGRLGSGGMGVVYLAFGPDNAPVALKVLQPFLAEDPEYRARFVREVSAAQLVDSPYVAKLVAAETQSVPLWMATEYVEGPTLEYAVSANGPVPPDRLRGLAADLAAAVAALHDVGLVHRDLKPANVVLAWSGPKLIDFGIAKQEGATGLTKTGVSVGSILWMSPEALSDGNVGRPADVFGWGLCIARAGTGRPPFGTGDANAVAFRIMSGQPDLRGLPAGMTELVAAALAKDPQARPTARQLGTALRGSGPLQPTAVAMPRPEGGWTGPNPQPAGVAAPPPPDGGRRDRKLLWPLAILALLVIGGAVAITLVATSGAKSSAGPPPSPSPSASPTPSVTASPSAPPTSSPTTQPSTPPPSTAPVLASLSSAEATVTADGYTPYQNSSAFWDPTAPINVILGTLTNSADGFNNWAFFFAGNRYIGHDTADPSLAIAIQGRTPDVITLSYTLYGPNDPNCCPTGGMQAVRFQWNGTSLVPLDPIPGEDPTQNHR